ncbi:hypothetical protein Y032_0084g1804 [Ancylostoma ceylanicum]|uniref:Uncharacterized protein n=1 Tax=Ancylostoma ceylanicum TaxID=53326 RepID=A0A016TRW6_9BILA|nr:hypothetical protein Y032_0084g1804 [Ancylostoma ceylanicum]
MGLTEYYLIFVVFPLAAGSPRNISIPITLQLIALIMEKYPGFHYENIDQKARLAASQEHVNRRVLSEYIKVINVPNTEKLNVRDLVQKFLKEVVRYNNTKDNAPLSWATSTGSNGETSSFRVKMSDSFWSYFTGDGRKKLIEYNRKERANVKVIRDQTISLSDLENLSLYLRRKIKLYYQSRNSTPPDVSVKNGYVTIGNYGKGTTKRYRATELAVLLGWNYQDWQGTAIKELMTNTEKRNMAEGLLTWGSLSIELFKSIEPTSMENIGQEQQSSNESAAVSNGNEEPSINKEGSRKRTNEDVESNQAKIHKPEMTA